MIAAVLQKALGSLGVASRPCVLTSNAAEAHVLVWMHGYLPLPHPSIPSGPGETQELPPVPRRADHTFLSWPGYPAQPLPGVGSRPAATGHAGVDAMRPGAITLGVAALALTAALALVARALTRRRDRT